MSDQNTTTGGQAVETNGEATAKLYPTRAECEANKPADASKALRAFEVNLAGVSKGWVLARGHGHAVEVVARLDGYSASTGVKQAPITKEAVAAKLADFTDDELAAMGLSRKPQKGGKK